MGAPAEQRVAVGVIIGIVVTGDVDGLTSLHIALVFLIQRVLVILGVADDKDLPAGLGREQHRACRIALGQNAQITAGINGGAVQPGPAAVRGIEHLIKAAHQRVGRAGDAVLKHAEHLFVQMHLGDAKMVVQTRQRTPTKVNRRVDILLGVVHDPAKLVPIVHGLIVQILNGGAGDDHAVKALVPDLIKGLVKSLHVLGCGVGRTVGGSLQKGDLHLQRAVCQQAGQLGLCHDLGRHQVEDQDAQRADVLAHSALLMHDKDIFLLQLVIGGQVFRDDQRHGRRLLTNSESRRGSGADPFGWYYYIDFCGKKQEKCPRRVSGAQGGQDRLLILDIVDKVLHHIALQHIHLDIVLAVGGHILGGVGRSVVAAEIGVHRCGVAAEAHLLGHSLHEQGLLGDGADAVVRIRKVGVHIVIAAAHHAGGKQGVHGGAVVLRVGVDAVQQHIAVVVQRDLGQLIGVADLVVQGGVDLAGLIVIEHRALDKRLQLVNAVQVHRGGEVLLHPVIGQLGGDGLLDVVQGRLKDGLLAAQVRVAVVFGEGDGDIKGLAGGMADDLILKAVDKGTAAEGQVVAAALTVAAVKGNAVNAAHIVDVDGIAVRSGAVGDLRVGRKAGKDIRIDIVGDVVLTDLTEISADRDVGVVIGQIHIVGSGHALEVAVLIKRIGKAEISQISVGGIIGGLAGGGGVGGRSRLSGGGGCLVIALAAGGQGSGHADSQTKGRQTVDMIQFHGYLLFLYKIAYHNIIHTFLKK